jgi:hypothetical protein
MFLNFNSFISIDKLKEIEIKQIPLIMTYILSKFKYIKEYIIINTLKTYLKLKDKNFLIYEIAFFFSGIIGSTYFFNNRLETANTIPIITGMYIFSIFVYFFIFYNLINTIKTFFRIFRSLLSN